jgi:hypothetical protein
VEVSAEDGWTTRDRAAALSSCEQTASRLNTREYAATYCSCIFESITPRWSYSELQQKEAAIIESISKDGSLSKCLQTAGKSQSDNLAQTAKAADMPDGFFGVRLNSSAKDVKAVRPNLKENSGSLQEAAEWNGKTFDVSYAVNPFSNEVFFISMERPSDEASYLITNSELNSEFGPLSSPAKEGLWLLKSKRTAGGVELTHVLADKGAGLMEERITLGVASD